ncbi:Prolyl endopeptidase [Dirofilaria immitis]|nr:Prolyl endopeptidase [Dirofilaria immitis]
MSNTVRYFRFLFAIVIVIDSGAKNPTKAKPEAIRSFHSSALWLHNHHKRGFEMITIDGSKFGIDSSKYPLARKDDSIVDDFHGTKVADPYRWLEDPDLNETKEFVEKLNSISQPFIASSPYREKLRKRLTELWNHEKFGCSSRRGDYYYYYYNSGLQNQRYVRFVPPKTLHGKSEVFLDPNKLSEDGTTSVRQHSFTHDGSILAYGLSEKGSDWMTVKFKKADGIDLNDTILGVKHSNLDWLIDNSGVFYSTYPEHKSALEGSSTEKHEYHSLYFHKLGTSQSDDVLVADFRSHPEYMCSGSVTEDGRYLLVDVSRGTDPYNMLYYYDVQEAKQKLPFIDNDDDTALILTNHDAPLFKLVRVKMSTAHEGSSAWETVIPEDKKNRLEWVANVGGDRLVVSYIEDVKNKLYVHCPKTGERFYEIPLEIGTVSGFLAEFRRISIKGVDICKFIVKQAFCTSKDGAKIPLYIIHNKNLVLNGNTPALLYGYGGFNIAQMPHFSTSFILFLDNFKGILISVNLRGGSEYGEKWHEDGMRERKQNVFDDFISAAEYLITNNYTSPRRLAIYGGSNGGLLVGAVSQQRPELFGAVLNQVGVLDMLRYHKFTIGNAWIPEYGNPDEASDFEFIYKYSPLHNIKIPNKGYQWPSTMLMTADHDDRVVPSHSLKYMARLYEAAQSSNSFQKKPLIIRVDVKAGHGAGKPTSKRVADPYRWLEDPDLNETKEFVEKLNSISQPFIASSPYREKLRKRLTELWNHEKFGCSSRRGDYYYYYYNSGLQNQRYVRFVPPKTLHGKSEVFLDPNKLSEDGTTSVRQHSFTHDGSILAYGLSEKGSDWMTVKFKKADGIDLNDTILGVKHSNLDWLIDNSGVFYSTYPEHKSALEGSSTEKHEYHSLYFHKLGTSQSDDVLVADFRSHPEYMWFKIFISQNFPNNFSMIFMIPYPLTFTLETNIDLLKYRRMARFYWRDLQEWLYGLKSIQFKDNVFEKLQTDNIFARDWRTLTMDENRQICNRWWKQLVEYNFIKFDGLKTDPERFVDFTEVLEIFDQGLTAKFYITAMFYVTVLSMGTNRHYHILEKCMNNEIVGCFCLTELSHGSNANSIRTECHYDKGQFVMHSPDDEAIKCWAGNLGENATHAIIFAQLYINHTFYGLHAFCIQIRHLKNMIPLKGIIIGDMKEKTGAWNGIDNGWMKFDKHRFHLDALLNRIATVHPDGIYQSAVKNIKEQQLASLAILSIGRAAVVGKGVVATRLAAVIATRYSAVRKQFRAANDAEERSVIEYSMQQHRLFPHIATSVALTIFYRKFISITYKHFVRCAENEKFLYELMLSREIWILSCAAKVISTEEGVSALDNARLACGAYGFLKSSRLNDLRDAFDPSRTFEGDNNILMQQVTYALLSLSDKNSYSWNDSPLGSLLFLTATPEKFSVWQNDPLEAVKEDIKNKVNQGFDEQQARMEAQAPENIRTVLHRLAAVYAYNSIDKHIATLYIGGYCMGGEWGNTVKKRLRESEATILSDVISICDTLAPPDFLCIPY